MSEQEDVLKDVALSPLLKSKIVEIAKKSGTKKQLVNITCTIMLRCFGDDGIERIKEALRFNNDNLRFHYLGAPRYQLILAAESYKEGEQELNTILEKLKAFAKNNNCEFGFERE